MPRYTSITIIYNPNSTRDSRRLVKELRGALKIQLPKQKVAVRETERPGHAEELAYALAMASKQPLIISASGDGGYHEVVNGLMRAKHDGADPIAGLLPGGNANDHYNNLHTQDTATAIHDGNEQLIDLLTLRTVCNGQLLERYAHSYIGVGLTPKVGQELNKTQLNRFKEVWIVSKALLLLEPVRLTIRGKTRNYDSIIFSNVHRMSKIFSVSKQSAIDDGKFEVTIFTKRHKLKLIISVLWAAGRGLSYNHQSRRYQFTPHHDALVQLDGEIRSIDAGVETTIGIEQQTLRCII